MPLNLNDLMKKAKEKGISQDKPAPSTQLFRPWQQESVLYNPSAHESREQRENNERTTREQDKSSQLSVINQPEENLKDTVQNPEKNETNSEKDKAHPENDEGTTREQTREQLEIKQRTSREQRENNQRTIREHQENKSGNDEGTIGEQRGNKPENDLENKPENDSYEVIKFSLINLIGLQKKLFDYSYELCSSKGELSTGSISTFEMAKSINCSYDSAKVTLKRLIIKGLIRRLPGKGCRGGFINLEIPKLVKSIASNIKKIDLSGSIQENNRENKPENNRENTAAYTSSSSKNTTTTSEIDIEPLIGIGFSMTHLQQILDQNKLEIQIIQNSIYAFAFDLEVNNKAKNIKVAPLNYFMGILKNGRPYAPPSNYESPEDKAMRIYLERVRAVSMQKEEMEKELRELDFKDWEASLGEEGKETLLPDEIKKDRMKAPKTSFLIRYHSENIWPLKRNELLAKFHIEHKK